jgi:hypothetical protein
MGRRAAAGWPQVLPLHLQAQHKAKTMQHFQQRYWILLEHSVIFVVKLDSRRQRSVNCIEHFGTGFGVPTTSVLVSLSRLTCRFCKYLPENPAKTMLPGCC